MPTIYDRTRPSEADKVLSMSGEEIARKFSIDSSWKHIRIGILNEISRSTAANIPSVTFAFGLTAGTSSLYGDASTNHFVGLASTPSQNMGYGPTYTPPVYQSATLRVVTKVATTTTAWATGLTWEMPTISDTSSMFRVVLFVDFMRPASDPGIMNVRAYTPHASAQNWNNGGQETQDNFDLWMSQVTASATQTDKTPVSFPISESINGTLDSVNIYWGQANPPLEISKVSVYRFS
jgi:hypothetical protein